jgi:CheY-like chemotaxis protein
MLSADKIDLEKIHFLIVDDNQNTLMLLSQVITGFGARDVTRCASVEAAIKVLETERIDFILTDAEMPEQTGYDLVHWLRREAREPVRFTPAVVVTGHNRLSNITKARDGGASFVIAKPIQPGVLLERIFWVAKDLRMFVDSEAYAGPDRRFRYDGAPVGEPGRRSDDPVADPEGRADADPGLGAQDADAGERKVAV